MTYTAIDMLRSMQHELDLGPPAEEHRRQTGRIFSTLFRFFQR